MSLLRHRILLAPVAPSASAVDTPSALMPLAVLQSALRLWTWSGLIALLLFAELRGSHALIGWLPFWLLVWPLCSQLLLRQRLQRS
jgi:hypothetical protein